MKIFLIVFCMLILILCLRGFKGNPTVGDLNSNRWQEDGPFELSPERGRFALTYSIVENKSFIFSLPLAKFATPDVGYINNNYVSVFDPGVSFLALPGYILGKYFNISQVGSFLIIPVFAIVNVLLIYITAIRLKSSKLMAAMAGFTFIFATPAFAYGVTLYQHHITTFLILCSIYLILEWKGIFSVLLIWLFFVLAIIIDYPNGPIMLPIILYLISKTFNLKKVYENFKLKIKLQYIFAILITVIPVGLLLIFNQLSYGNPLIISGMTPRAIIIDVPQKIENVTQSVDIDSEKSVFNFFRTRNLLNGLYILFLSPDRGVINYAPIIIIGLLGLFVLPIKKDVLSVIISVILMNIILYAMWGDVWGGWSFGSRYLIPSYALLSIFIATFLTNTKYKILALLIFCILFSYSVFINTAGALTTNKIPPQVEILNLEKISGQPQKFNYLKNFDELSANNSKSFVYNTFLKKDLTSWQYFWIIFGSIEVGLMSILIYFFIKNKNEGIRI